MKAKKRPLTAAEVMNSCSRGSVVSVLAGLLDEATMKMFALRTMEVELGTAGAACDKTLKALKQARALADQREPVVMARTTQAIRRYNAEVRRYNRLVELLKRWKAEAEKEGDGGGR